MHFLNDEWKPCHVIINFFETTETSRSAMASQVNEVFGKHGGSMLKLLVMPNDEGNLSTMIITFIFCCFMWSVGVGNNICKDMLRVCYV